MMTFKRTEKDGRNKKGHSSGGEINVQGRKESLCKDPEMCKSLVRSKNPNLEENDSCTEPSNESDLR